MKELLKKYITLLEFGVFSLLVYLRVFCAGISYYPALDDYIQYGCYPKYPDIINDVFFRTGNLAKRPLATLADVYVWGKMWEHMWIALVVIALLYILTVYFLYKCFDMDRTRCGTAFLLLAMSPLLGEGLYWISASSRIVVGMFFGALACYTLKKSYVANKNLNLTVSALSLVISMGFYEQIIVAIPVLMGLIMLKNRNKTNILKRLWIPAVAVGLIGIYYIVAGRVFGADSRVSEGVTFGFDNIMELTGQSIQIFKDVCWQYMTDTFMFGLNNVNGFVVALIGLLSIAFGICHSRKSDNKPKNARFMALCGGVMCLVSLSIHCVSLPVWVCLRNVFIAVLGIGMLLCALCLRIKLNRYVGAIMVAVIAFVFSVSGAGDTLLYKKVYEYDVALATSVAQQIAQSDISDSTRVYVVSDNRFYETLPSYYKDHLKSVIYSDWSLTGAVRAVSGDLYLKTITPVTDVSQISTENDVFILHEENGITKRIE